jgi:hypothetical protein
MGEHCPATVNSLASAEGEKDGKHMEIKTREENLQINN